MGYYIQVQAVNYSDKCQILQNRMGATPTDPSFKENLVCVVDKGATSATREGINKVFKVGEVYSLKDAKVELQKIYDRLKISKKAKATDLEDYFKIELTSKRIDKKMVQCISLENN